MKKIGQTLSFQGRSNFKFIYLKKNKHQDRIYFNNTS